MQCLLTNPMVTELVDYAWYLPVREKHSEREGERETDRQRQRQTERERERDIHILSQPHLHGLTRVDVHNVVCKCVYL